MAVSRFGSVFASCYYICVVLALILLQGCSGAAKLESTGYLPRLTTETFEEQSRQVLNPETGELEKHLVQRTHTTVTQTSSAITPKEGGLNLEKLSEYLDLISSGLDVLIDILYLTSK